MTGVCQATLPFLTNLWTWLGIAGLGILGKLAYSYSSLTFWPSFLAFSTIYRTIAVTISAITSLLNSNLTKYVATITTFSQTIQYLLTGNISLTKLFETLIFEFYDKVILTVKNIVEGLSIISEWLAGIDQGVCALGSNLGVLGNGLLSIWVGAAAFIFILWIWNLTWYDWRNVEMESQEKLLVIALVAAVSISAHSTELVMQGLSNGVSLSDTLTQLGGKWLETGGLNETVNESLNATN